MKKCPNCGHETTEHEKLCPNCLYDFETESFENVPVEKITKPTKGQRIITTILSIGAIAIYLGFLGWYAMEKHERVERLEQLSPDRLEVSGSFESISNSHPGTLDEFIPFYNDFIDYVENFPSEGEDYNTYVFYGKQLETVYLDATIEYQDYDFEAYYWYNGDLSTKKLIMRVPYIKSKGIDRNQLKAYCELTQLSDTELFKTLTDAVNEIGKNTSYYKNLNLKNKELSLWYSGYDLQVYYPIE